jgi:hypothetical protein
MLVDVASFFTSDLNLNNLLRCYYHVEKEEFEPFDY